MTLEQMRAAHNAQPFQPFVIHLADGRDIPVAHREFLAIGPTGRTTMVIHPDESWNIIDLQLVTNLEIKPAASPPSERRKA